MIKSALEQLKEDEGFRGSIYQCTEGKNTIGYGRNLDDNPLTREEAQFLLENDLEKVARQAQKFPWYKTLTSERRAVILNMIYNLGINRFKQFKLMIAALYVEDYELAAKEMLNSKWAKQVKGRALRLSMIMKG